MAVGLVLAIVPIAAPPAFAARAASATVDRTVSYRGTSQTYAFTVNNTSTASETLASVAFGAPSASWSITACGPAPTGWTSRLVGGYCVYDSSTGTADDIAAGSAKTFSLTASGAVGTSTVIDAWNVYADSTDTMNSNDADGVLTITAGTLTARLYAIEVTDIVVSTTLATVNGACPPANRKAPAGSTRYLVVCGSNLSGSSFSVRNQDSSLGGTFLADDGWLSSSSVPTGRTNVVLANYNGSVITSTVATGRTVTTTIANRGFQAGPQTFLGYTTDTTAPGVPSVPDLAAASDTGSSATDNITSDSTPTFTGSAEANSTVDILMNGSVVATTTASGAGAYSATVPGGSALVDGVRSLTARATDASGNVSAASSVLSITVDTSAPADVSIVDAPSDLTTDDTPQWIFSGEASATFACVLVKPDLSQETDNACVSPKTWNLASFSDGAFSFRVSQTDRAGNTSSPTTDSFELDRAAPDVPAIGTQPADASSDATPTWSFAGESGGSFECVLVTPNTEIGTSCTSPKTYNLSFEEDGTYTFKVRQLDRFGNTGAYALDSFVLDRQAPAAPSITANPATRTQDDTPTWEFTGEAGTRYECELSKPGGAELTDSNCATPKAYALATDPDGSYTFRVRQIDDAGNASAWVSHSTTLDRLAPAAPVFTSQPKNYDDNPAPEWAFSGEATGVFECILVSPGGGELSVPSCTSPRVFDLSASADGDYTFKVRQIDSAGNVGPYATDAYTFDRTPPRPTVTGGSVSGPTSDPVHELTFGGVPGATFECRTIRPGGPDIVVENCTSPHTFDLTNESDGEFTLSVRQFLDDNGSVPTTVTFTLDRFAEAPVITTKPPARTRDLTPDFGFTGEVGATFDCALTAPDGTRTTELNCSDPGFVLQKRDGRYTFEVAQTDAAGNVSAPTLYSFLLDVTKPKVKAFKVSPAKVNPATVKTFKIGFKRSEKSSALVTIKKGRKAVKKFKVKMGTKKVVLGWRVVKGRKVAKPGKYIVMVKLTDRVGLKSTAKKVVKVLRAQ